VDGGRLGFVGVAVSQGRSLDVRGAAGWVGLGCETAGYELCVGAVAAAVRGDSRVCWPASVSGGGFKFECGFCFPRGGAKATMLPVTLIAACPQLAVHSPSGIQRRCNLESTTLKNVLLTLVVWAAVAWLGASAGAEDWPMYGRDGSRNAVSPEKNPPTDFQAEIHDDAGKITAQARNVKWHADLGGLAFSFGSAVVSAAWCGSAPITRGIATRASRRTWGA